MDVIKLNIPAQFVLERVRLTWREALYGIENALLDPQAAVDLAVDCLVRGSSSEEIVELAGLRRADSIRAHVETLARAEPAQPAGTIEQKWLYIVLAWLFENRASYEDPLQMVEQVYADFDYPSRIAGFVRYMPMEEPDLGSRQLNEQRLYEKWKRYLDSASAEYSSTLKTENP